MLNEKIGENKVEFAHSEKSRYKDRILLQVGGSLGIFLIILLIIGITGFMSDWGITGFSTAENSYEVVFLLNDSWNLSHAYVNATQENKTVQWFNLEQFVFNQSLLLKINDTDFESGEVVVGLYVNSSLVAEKYVFIEPSFLPEIIEETYEENTSEEVEEEAGTSGGEEEAGTSSSEELLTTSEAPYLVDFAQIEPPTPFTNSKLNCTNGSISDNVTELLYLWYVNKTLLAYQNFSSLDSDNFTTHDEVDCAILPRNQTSPLVYWPLDAGRGSIAYEIVANRSGVITDPAWVEGRNYQAINFTTITNVTIFPGDGLNLTKKFTFEFWVKVLNGTVSPQTIYHHDNFDIALRQGKIAAFFPLNGGSTVKERINSSNTLPLGNWTFVSLTYDNAVLSLYLNGTLNSQTTLPGGDLGNINGSEAIVLGQGDSGKLIGLLDEFVIYNESLNASQILSHYEDGISRLSRNSRTEIRTNVSHFTTGNCSENVNCTKQPGNVTLANSSSTAFFPRGNFTTRAIDILNGAQLATLHFNNVTPSGNNLSFQVRSGALFNGSVRSGEFSGPDYSLTPTRDLVLGLDFSEIGGNVSQNNFVHGTEALMQNNDIDPLGKHGSAASFFSIQDVIVPDYREIQLRTANFTISLWINPSDNTNVGILHKDKYQIGIDSDSKLQFLGEFSSESGQITSSQTIPANQWTHIAFTKDSQGNVIMFINGVVETGDNLIGIVVDNSGVDMEIGDTNVHNKFKGRMDSIAIYNRTLSLSEVYSQARDRFTNSGEIIGDINRYVEVKALFESDSQFESPTLLDLVVQAQNYSTIILNQQPSATNLSGPVNGSNFTQSAPFNWSASADLENDTIFYELHIANDTEFRQTALTRLAINNYSEVEISDDNFTILVEHFENRISMEEYGWSVGSSESVEGRFGKGLRFLQAVNVPLERDLLNVQQGTIEFWFNPAWNDNDLSQNNQMVRVGNDISVSRQNMSLTYFFNGTTLTHNISDWSKGEWHHIAVNWDTNTNISLIVDGVKENSTASPGYNPGTNGINLGSNSGSNHANGTIDELRLSKIARLPWIELTSTMASVNVSAISDGTYYWRVRAANYQQLLFDNETVYSNWTQPATITFESQAPTVSPLNQEPARIVIGSNTTIAVSTSEPATCEFSNLSTSFVAMNVTGGVEHNHSVVLDNGYHSYFVKCADSFGKTGNTTISFYGFENDGNKKQGIAFVDFVAGEPRALNISSTDNTFIGGITLTTQDNISGRIALVRYGTGVNPEANGINMKDRNFRAHNWIIDQQILNNLTGNITLLYTFQSSEFSGGIFGSQDMGRFNLSTNQWDLNELTYPVESASVGYLLHNVTDLGTFSVTIEVEEVEESGGSVATFGEEAMEEALEEEVPLEFIYDTVLTGHEYVADIFDTDLGLIDILFITNKDLRDVILSVSAEVAELDDSYKAFSVEGVNIEDEDFDLLLITMGVDLDWVNSFSADTEFALFDEEGVAHQMYYVSEDSDFMFFESEPNKLGTFTIAVLPEGVSVLAAPSLAPELDEDTTEEDLGILEAIPAGIETIGFGKAIFYLLVSSAVLFFGSRLGMAIISTGRKYRINKDELKIEKIDEDKIKLYAYQHRSRPNLEKELVLQGLSSRRAKHIISKLDTVKRNKLSDYIFAQLVKGVDEEELVKKVTQKGWKRSLVTQEIEKFHNL